MFNKKSVVKILATFMAAILFGFVVSASVMAADVDEDLLENKIVTETPGEINEEVTEETSKEISEEIPEVEVPVLSEEDENNEELPVVEDNHSSDEEQKAEETQNDTSALRRDGSNGTNKKILMKSGKMLLGATPNGGSSYDDSLAASDLVSKLLGGSISASNQNKYGGVYYYEGPEEDFGLSEGVVLTTNSCSSDIEDPELAALISAEEQSYGYFDDIDGIWHRHTSCLDFRLVATGTLLNFNYVFASCEFPEGPTFNDVFGLFVSVNGAPYENIAMLDNGRYITMTNLRAGVDGTQLSYGVDEPEPGIEYDYFTSKEVDVDIADNPMNGVSNLFTASKAVNIGDTVDIKFVIADVGDTSYDSMVIIQAGSLSFDAPKTKTNYSDEMITDFEPGSTYEISCEEESFLFTIDSTGSIPLQGTDKNGKPYDFIGKKISIVKKGDGVTIGDFDPQNVTVSDRPAPPQEPVKVTDKEDEDNITNADIITSENKIVIVAEEGTVYSLDGENWFGPDENGYVIFDELLPGQEYVVKAHKPATSKKPASEEKEILITIEETPVVSSQSTENPRIYETNKWTDKVIYNGEELFIDPITGDCIIVGDGESHDLIVIDKAGNKKTIHDVVGYSVKTHRFENYQEDPNYPGKLVARCEDDGCEEIDIMAIPPVDFNASSEIEKIDSIEDQGSIRADVISLEGENVTQVSGLTIDVAKNGLSNSGYNLKEMYTDNSQFDVSMIIEPITDEEDIEYAGEYLKKVENPSAKIVKSLDIYIQMYKDNIGPDLLSDTKVPLTLKFKLGADELAPAGKYREYFVYRVHDDKITKLDSTFDKNTGTLTTKSSLYSEYFIGYTETDAPVPGPEPGPGTSASGSGPVLIAASTVSPVFWRIHSSHPKREIPMR